MTKDGRIHGFIANVGWVDTGDTAPPEVVAMLRQPGVYSVEESRKEEPLYRDPRLNYVPIPRPPEVPTVNGLAKVARTFSFLGILFMPLGIIGLILGFMALGQIEADDAESRSVAITGVIVGLIFTIITFILVVLIVSH